MNKPNVPRLELGLMITVLAVLAWSGYEPQDRITWYLEVAPVVFALPLLALTHGRFPLTRLIYVLIAGHAIILVVGGHYTYAKVPLGYWLQDWFALSRNPYDRIGHFAQGFAPAMIAREILVRCSPLRGSRWLAFIVVCFCLALSAFYELIEWWAALISGEAATAFLGTQGDVWDTQWDMFLALTGAIVALGTLSRLHDRQLSRLRASP